MRCCRWQYLSKELQVLCEVNQQVYDITNLFKEHVPTVPQDANLQHVVALLEQVIGDYEVVGEVAADGQQTTPGRAISEGSVSEILARFLLQQSSTAANHVLPQHTSHVLLSNIKQQRERIAFTLNSKLRYFTITFFCTESIILIPLFILRNRLVGKHVLQYHD